MTDAHDSPDDLAFFRERYGATRARAACRVETAALGHDVGLNGYTTVAQASALCRPLEIGPGHRLLDLGAGRGWPGLHIAAELGSRLLSIDLPWEALAAAKARGAEWVLGGDGRALPVRTGSCDAIVHAGGRLAGYIIHTPEGLSAAEAQRAAELGPPNVAASLDTLTRRAGLTVVGREDVTMQFRDCCESLLRARTRLESVLRAEEGDEAFDEEHARKTDMLTGIHERLLLRSLVVAAAPPRRD